MAEEEFVPEGDDADETAPDGADTGDDAGKTDGSTEDESDPIEWDPSAIIDASMTVLEADQFSAASAYTEGQTPGPETEDATSTAGQDGANVVTEEDDDSEQDQETWDSLDHYDSDGTGPLTPAQIAAKDTDLGWWMPSSVTVTVQGAQETQGCVRWAPYSDEELFQLYGSDRVAAVEAHFWHDSAGAHVSTTANDATTGPNVLIDTNSLDIRDGTDVLASFGQDIVLGMPGSGSARFTDGSLAFWDTWSWAHVSRVIDATTQSPIAADLGLGFSTVTSHYGGANDGLFDVMVNGHVQSQERLRVKIGNPAHATLVFDDSGLTINGTTLGLATTAEVEALF